MDRIKFYFIACLVTLNGLFIGYALGLNSRYVLIVDPKLPKYVKPVAVTKAKAEQAIESTMAVTKKADGKSATESTAKPGHSVVPSGHSTTPAHVDSKKTGSKQSTGSHTTGANHATAAAGHQTQSDKTTDAKSSTTKATPTPSKATTPAKAAN